MVNFYWYLCKFVKVKNCMKKLEFNSVGFERGLGVLEGSKKYLYNNVKLYRL